MPVSKLPTEFGIFYPTGWTVVAFPRVESAEQVQRDLLTGGYDEQECKLVRSDELVPLAQGHLAGADWLSRLGKADEMLERQLAAAHRGSAFLVIYAPTESEVERVMNVVRRVPFEFAHRYRRLAIEVLK
jgi:hypothetical protein